MNCVLSLFYQNKNTMADKRPDVQLLLENQICFQFYAVSRAFTQAYQPLLEPLDLTYPQYLVMLVLWEEDGLTVKQVGERLLLDSGTLTPLLKKLEIKGFLSRQRSANDERQVLITLTNAGRALKTEALSIPEKLICALGVPYDDLSPVRTFLSQVLASLQACNSK